MLHTTLITNAGLVNATFSISSIAWLVYIYIYIYYHYYDGVDVHDGDGDDDDDVNGDQQNGWLNSPLGVVRVSNDKKNIVLESSIYYIFDILKNSFRVDCGTNRKTKKIYLNLKGLFREHIASFTGPNNIQYTSQT